MGPRVGIPRALFFHYYFPWWYGFLEALGAEVVVSPPTNKDILDQGVREAVDEACLPIKVFYGHVLALKERVDLLFVPRIVSIEPKAYICPKFMGLPDMIRASIPGLPQLIDVTVDLRSGPAKLKEAVYGVGGFFTHHKRTIEAAWERGREFYRQYRARLEEGALPRDILPRLCPIEMGKRHRRQKGSRGQRFQIALVGHGYNLYDSYISMDVIGKLENLGARVLTPDHLPDEVIDREAAKMPKRLFWSLGKRLIGSTLYFLQREDIDGLVHLASFGCGPDSLVGDLVERFSHRQEKIPFLYLTIDEQTGEAGIQTRVEAFTDMLAWRAAQ